GGVTHYSRCDAVLCCLKRELVKGAQQTQTAPPRVWLTQVAFPRLPALPPRPLGDTLWARGLDHADQPTSAIILSIGRRITRADRLVALPLDGGDLRPLEAHVCVQELGTKESADRVAGRQSIER